MLFLEAVSFQGVLFLWSSRRLRVIGTAGSGRRLLHPLVSIIQIRTPSSPALVRYLLLLPVKDWAVTERCKSCSDVC